MILRLSTLIPCISNMYQKCAKVHPFYYCVYDCSFEKKLFVFRSPRETLAFFSFFLEWFIFCFLLLQFSLFSYENI